MICIIYYNTITYMLRAYASSQTRTRYVYTTTNEPLRQYLKGAATRELNNF